jgi:hypothetical protein
MVGYGAMARYNISLHMIVGWLGYTEEQQLEGVFYPLSDIAILREVRTSTEAADWSNNLGSHQIFKYKLKIGRIYFYSHFQ